MKIIAAAMIVLALSAAPALADHPGRPPHAVSVISRVYPDLAAREIARTPTSWERLRRMARTRWRATHPCARETLEHNYRSGLVSSWGTMLAVWNCDGVDPSHISFMACIPKYEGGYGAPDVRFGGASGDPSGLGLGNVVLGHLQLRPAWYRGAMNGRPGTYALPDSWDHALYVWAKDPINQARATAPLGREQYATAGFC